MQAAWDQPVHLPLAQNGHQQGGGLRPPRPQQRKRGQGTLGRSQSPGDLSGLCPRQAPWLPPPGPGPRQGPWGSGVELGGGLLMVTLGLDQQSEPRGSSCPELGTWGFLGGHGPLSPHQPRAWWGLTASRPRPRLWPWQRKWQDRASAGAGSEQPRGHSPVTGCVGWGSVFPGTGGLGGAPQVPSHGRMPPGLSLITPGEAVVRLLLPHEEGPRSCRPPAGLGTWPWAALTAGPELAEETASPSL